MSNESSAIILFNEHNKVQGYLNSSGILYNNLDKYINEDVIETLVHKKNQKAFIKALELLKEKGSDTKHYFIGTFPVKNLTKDSFEVFLTDFGNKKLKKYGLILNKVNQKGPENKTNLTALLQGQENERQRIAKELHDGIGPIISTIRLNLESIEVKDIKEERFKLKQTIEYIDTIMRDVRNLSHNLLPSSLLDFGLVIALEDFCSNLNLSGRVHIHFSTFGLSTRLEYDLELHLFRISQELINNATKSPNVSEIVVQIIKRENKLLLMVEDNGAGYNKQGVKQSTGIGLRNIQTRTKVLNGTFLIESSEKSGTVAILEIPL